ncbi:50S ribosomal protein L11 methyltransferase [Kordiimonas aquimaris]|uniref:50S ribosomal protein L11 methyltransferase n=1 Tax=Kordiimonas aquimaris TaxID=707591 RepID=UPI0021CE3C1B|nr:50S ribosomal protein L11 methyltransferase [Kordiimonas aquimaris]
MTQENTGWCLSGQLPREKSEALETSIEVIAEMQGIFPPTSSSFEQDDSPLWQVDVYFTDEADTAFIDAVLTHAGLEGWTYTLTPIEDRDWVSESQKLLAPVRAGRFLVFGSHDADKRDPKLINLQIDAGQAFGTGKHETTSACLKLIDKIGQSDVPDNMLDIGTGTGVLALAAAKLWPSSTVTATDIDPIAIDVTRLNLGVNDALENTGGPNEDGIYLIVADGLKDDALQRKAPYNLIVANILAGPLITMAQDIIDATARSGKLILSGLLITQKEDVLAAYESKGMSLIDAVEQGDWTALYLKRA